jgi:ribosome biogenesis protein SSF1/2
MLGDLESDLRRMMLPNTASSLRESKRNSLKDFVSVAGPLGVSHFLMLTATEKATYLRVAKAPRVSSKRCMCCCSFAG